jgi:hypothetical protein
VVVIAVSSGDPRDDDDADEKIFLVVSFKLFIKTEAITPSLDRSKHGVHDEKKREIGFNKQKISPGSSRSKRFQRGQKETTTTTTTTESSVPDLVYCQ